MGKEYEDKSKEIKDSQTVQIGKRIRKILSNKLKMESIGEERKENWKSRKNLILGVYSK